MVMRPREVVELVQERLLPLAGREAARLGEIDRWLGGDNPVARLAGRVSASRERDYLTRLSSSPVLRLIVEQAAQQMIVDGVARGGDGGDTSALWGPWDVNGMPTRQGALWTAALGYGSAYVMVSRGVAVGGGPGAVLRAYSPRNLVTVYGDTVEDEYPMWALRSIRQGDKYIYRLWDEENVYFLAQGDNGGVEFVSFEAHGMGVCPVVRFDNSLDLEGRSLGEVERYRTVASRYDKTTLDRLLIQHHNSFRVRTATGLSEPVTAAEKESQKLTLAHDTILTGAEGVQFGSLPETQMDGILRAGEADRDMLAAVSQTPVWSFNGGQLINLSAEALVEARSVSRQKIEGKQRAMGRGVCQVLRLAAHAEGRAEDAADFSLRVQWADLEARSMSQMADALGKITGQLKVPAELLWEMIPGVSKTRADQWRAYRESNPGLEDLLNASLVSGG